MSEGVASPNHWNGLAPNLGLISAAPKGEAANTAAGKYDMARFQTLRKEILTDLRVELFSAHVWNFLVSPDLEFAALFRSKI